MLTRWRQALVWLVGVTAATTLAVVLSPSSGSEFDPTKLPACATEDSAGPCYWDAKTRGNGQGVSFWIDEHQQLHRIN